jgi:gamma-glutamyltranspeptidase/glutathione hydrolase
MRLRLITLAALTLMAACVAAASPAGAAQGSKFRKPVLGKLGVVATESPAAATVGRRVLERGGNAVDAAVATVFALNVARPQSCGIGGGGFMVYRSAKGRSAALDFRETAPAAFTPTTLQPPGLHSDNPGDRNDFTGHLTVGVPGTVAGMRAALRRYGSISLAGAIAPAERLAARGVQVSPALSKSMEDNANRLKLFPAAANQYLVGGQTPYPAGSVLKQPDMARSLHAIAKHGTAAFYRGKIARQIARDMDNTRAGPQPGDSAAMVQSDLAGYRAKWRRPVKGRYRGRGLIAMPPPTSGGIAVVEMLNLLEGFNLKAEGQSSADALHQIIESQKIAWADRNEYVADPDFVNVPGGLTSKDYANRRRAEIDMTKAKKFAPGFGPYAPPQATAANDNGTTTHLSVIDRRGNAVAITCTIEQEFGSAVVAPGTGFLLNNEMTDFGKPGTANEPRAGKRPRSSMSPTIATEAGRPIVVTGGAGGSRIIMGSLFTVLNRLEYGLDLAHSVDAERVDAQNAPEKAVFMENARVDAPVVAELERRGHTFMFEGEYNLRPRVQAAGYRSPRSRVKQAVSDSRTELGSLAQRR